jgi:hypothetical protein
LRRLAALDGGRAHRTGGFGLRGKGIGKVGKARLHIGAAAGKADRHQRQHRDLRHPTRAKQLGEDGTWLLTRTQQNTVLSKHVPSK